MAVVLSDSDTADNLPTTSSSRRPHKTLNSAKFAQLEDNKDTPEGTKASFSKKVPVPDQEEGVSSPEWSTSEPVEPRYERPWTLMESNIRLPPTSSSTDDGVYVTNVEMQEVNSFKPPTPTYDHPEEEEKTRKCGRFLHVCTVFVSLRERMVNVKEVEVLKQTV
eukprot:sb/3472638/